MLFVTATGERDRYNFKYFDSSNKVIEKWTDCTVEESTAIIQLVDPEQLSFKKTEKSLITTIIKIVRSVCSPNKVILKELS